VRLAVYTDYTYQRVDGAVYAERAFALFLAGLRARCERLILVGRLSPSPGEARYPLGDDVELVGLPYYPRLSRPWQALRSFWRSMVDFWRCLPEVDVVWLLGPHPLAIGFAMLALVRRTRVVLGVRQDLPAYVRNRHPGRAGLIGAARVLEGAYRIMSRFLPVVTVGPELAARYGGGRAVLQITVSLISEHELISPASALARDYSDEIRLLAVGRIEREKNPLLLAEVLALLNRDEPRWRLVVCGEGQLSVDLEARLAQLGQAERASLLGYVRFGEQLRALYRDSHVLLHTSWTEGLPAVLPEAFAAGLPVVAADVGGIAAAVDGAALLVRPGAADEAARAVRAIADDDRLRERLVAAGHAYARAHTVDAEAGRLARFLRSG
jgi:glycosyltransferase involved in cell wall biosynthesis